MDFKPLLWNLRVGNNLNIYKKGLVMGRILGHSAEVFATRFDPAGHLIASGSMDRSISRHSQRKYGT